MIADLTKRPVDFRACEFEGKFCIRADFFPDDHIAKFVEVEPHRLDTLACIGSWLGDFSQISRDEKRIFPPTAG